MLKRTVRYTDFNGVSRAEDFYFNLSTNDLFTLEGQWRKDFGTKDVVEFLNRLTESRDGAEIVRLVSAMITGAYGIKSDDGRSFRKSKEITEEFASSAAWDALLFELVTNAEEAGKFVEALIPDSVRKNEKALAVQAPVNETKVQVPEITGEQVEAYLRSRQQMSDQPYHL